MSSGGYSVVSVTHSSKEGDICPNRIPPGLTVWLEDKGIPWYPMFVALTYSEVSGAFDEELEKTIGYGIAMVGPGAEKKKPANDYNVE
ncbi:Zn(II)2Cys6 transcription factor [Aspergillus luchuensis]|uniref:Zn(II)2Cys6 transcription factor n=1 Tax=Aspergillus kawachii TaxID=1069201 RepID=A0A146F6U8_ASPKA|nr:Zn(II)2Cys6 transcription factor [Aspergillus luchuensis]